MQPGTMSQRANCLCLPSNVSSDATNLSVVAIVEPSQVPILSADPFSYCSVQKFP